MKKRIITFILILCCVPAGLLAQSKQSVYAAAFYNLENLWDYEDDPNNPGDDPYTPNGTYQWTKEKYEQKLLNMATVISQLAREHCPEGPAIIGIAEVENRRVLEDLVKQPPIASTGYKIVHFESPDHRGIDVAALYNPKLFDFESATVYPYHNPKNPELKTRDQLLISGKLAGEPFHVIVNHWPSRYGGGQSSPLREYAATITKHIADSICSADHQAKILITGDLNDDPSDKSCSEVLGAKRTEKEAKKDGYYNATWKIHEQGEGTLCYQGKWNLFDQHIISSNLLNKKKRTLKFWKCEVFSRPFLIQQEGKYKGSPYRSFFGKKFQTNGYSDHLPTISYYIKKMK